MLLSKRPWQVSPLIIQHYYTSALSIYIFVQWTIPQLDKLSDWKTILAQLERAS